MAKITIIHNLETGVLEINSTDGELSQVEILGILTMAVNVVAQSNTRPISKAEQIQIEATNKRHKKRKYDA